MKIRENLCLIAILSWTFAANRLMQPKPVRPAKEMQTAGYIDKWICYKSSAFSAKELTVLPGQTVTIKDSAAYGVILIQGHGKIGIWDIETPVLIRFGQLTYDEFFGSFRKPTLYPSELRALEILSVCNINT